MDPTKLIGFLLAGVMLIFSFWQFGVLRRRRLILLAKKARIEKELFAFLYRQTVRRFEMAILFGLTAGGMVVGFYLSPKDYPRIFLFTWVVVLGFLVWAIFLTFFDYMAVRFHYSLEKRQNEAEKIGLEYALKKLQKKGEPEKKNDEES